MRKILKSKVCFASGVCITVNNDDWTLEIVLFLHKSQMLKVIIGK